MSKSQDPRIAPKEMIVTRFKSAQQRRQLRDKDRTIAKTQLVKSPPQKKGKKKTQKSPKKEKEIKETAAVCQDLDEDAPKEYYPEKLKRAPGARRQFLKPRPNMKTVVRTNKRKFNTPRKGLKPSHINHKPWSDDLEHSSARLRVQSPVYAELSMEEVVRIVEDTESLNDEDLMEILTCPSPVWWEEPADETYIEEAICSRNAEDSTLSPIKERCLQTYSEQVHKRSRKSRCSKDSKPNNAEDDFQMDASDIIKDEFKVIEKKDERFIKKRKKLENVLGNIKNKVSSNKIRKIDECAASYALKDEREGNKEAIESKEVVNDTADIKIKEEFKRSKVKRISESTEDDMADLTADDDMLLDLENMDIPVESKSDLTRPVSSASIIFINDDEGNKITVIDDDSDNIDDGMTGKDTKNASLDVLESKFSDLEDKGVNNLVVKKELIDAFVKNDANPAESSDTVSKVASSEKSNNTVDSEDSAVEKSNVNDDKSSINLTEVPKNLPPLKKRPKVENTAFASPISFKSSTDDTAETSSISSHDISDTISDTNVKFIMDDDIDYISDVDSRNEVLPKKEIKVEPAKGGDAIETKIDNVDDANSKDYITVYKIVANDCEKSNTKIKTMPEYSNHVEKLKHADVKTESEGCQLPETKGQLNSFFKKCKYANRKRKPNEAEAKNSKSDVKTLLCDSCEPKKCITVAQDENVKYCLKCSSIFDTDDCRYCLKSLKEPENVSKSGVTEIVGENSVQCSTADDIAGNEKT